MINFFTFWKNFISREFQENGLATARNAKNKKKLFYLLIRIINNNNENDNNNHLKIILIRNSYFL